jgi:hypothetical protein
MVQTKEPKMELPDTTGIDFLDAIDKKEEKRGSDGMNRFSKKPDKKESSLSPSNYRNS